MKKPSCQGRLLRGCTVAISVSTAVCMAEIFRLQICRADHLRFALFIYAKHTIKIEKSQSKLQAHSPAEPKDPFRLAELQHHRDCQGQRPEPVTVPQVPLRAPAERRHPAASRAPRRRPAMERDHPAKLQLNHPSSTAPQRSFLICASATTKGLTIKAMNYTPGDLALTVNQTSSPPRPHSTRRPPERRPAAIKSRR